MAGVGGSEYPVAPVPVLPAVSDAGQAAHVSGAGVPAGRCGKGVPVLCLYRELLMVHLSIYRYWDNNQRRSIDFGFKLRKITLL